ncbi:MAG: VCBS repeat-containing protein [Chitinophagaceae bacterium]
MRILYTVLLIISFCNGKAQPLFTLLPASKTGINFQNNIKESSTHNVLKYEYFYNGGGTAVGDLNNDGLPDIVFTANMDQPKVYFNKGNFVFDDVTTKSKIRADGWKTGVTMADVNADGWLDIYICRSGNEEPDLRRNLLFINQKNGTFKEMAALYNINDKGYSTQAAFFDYDNDGDLDMYLLNHPVKRYTRFDVAYMKSARDSLAGDKLFRNDGDHFTDVSVNAGIIGNPIGFGLGIAIADFNGDGWTDIYVSNDYDEDDYLYINQKDGTYKESLTSYIGHTSKFSMGSDVADINNDALPDLFTLDMLPEDNKRQKLLKGPEGYDYFQMLLRNGYYYQYMRNMLHLAQKNDGQIRFSEIGQMAGISNTDWSWSALFGDYDLDGWQDLFITNGYMRDYTNMDFLKYDTPELIKKARDAGKEPDLFDIVKKMPSSQVKNYLFKNTGKLEFNNMSQQWGMDAASLSNGAAYGDFDNDGDWDLVVNNINQPAFIWQNHAEDLKNNFLKIKFSGTKINPSGIGTKVIVSAEDGFQQIQELELVHGFQSSVEPCLVFGLGKRLSVTVTITWKDGKTQTLRNQPVNKIITIEYQNAGNEKISEKAPQMLFAENLADSLLFKHQEDEYNDFKREPLLPHQFSRNGPALAVGDVDGDGKDDFFIGGAKGQTAAIFINQGNGKFIENKNFVFEEYKDFENVEAIFADLDNDKDLDLYVVSGGNESNFQDHIFWNDGKGNFTYKPNIMLSTKTTGGAVVAFDFDKDGDLDVFRGSQVTTGAYPLPPQSYLLQNDKGIFRDITPDFLKKIGMISTAVAADINKDGFIDLILAGEYMPVTILWGQSKSPYFSVDKQQQIAHSSGWWNCIKIADIDQDGDLDIIAGNHGLNSQMKPTMEHPITIDAADIDNNGSMDAIISYYIQGKRYPLPTRDELFDQVPSLKTTFPTYKAYSDATIDDIFTDEQFKKATHLKTEEFRSGVFRNDGQGFHFEAFVNEAQVFPLRDFLIDDFNHDGLKDLLMIGNNFAVRAQSGRYDAGKGLLLISKYPDPVFSPVANTGFLAARDARKIIRIDNYLIVANNNDRIQIFTIN